MSCNMTHTSGHLTHLISESVKASIHALKLHHDRLKRHTTHGKRRRSGGGWSKMGWRSHRFSPWLLQPKLGFTSSNRHRSNGTYDGEMRRLGIRNRGVANDLPDSRKENKLITGCRILIDIYKGEYESERESQL